MMMVLFLGKKIIERNHVKDMSYDGTYQDIPGLVGSPFEFDSLEDLSFSSCTLSFKIKSSNGIKMDRI